MRAKWLVCLLCCCSHAAARDIYVSNLGGDDRRDGTNARSLGARSGPVATISKALRLAQPSDRIVLANTGQPYREALSLVGSQHGGSVLGPLVIEGQGARLDGSVGIPDDQWEHVAGDVFAYRPQRLGDQRLFVKGRPATCRPARWADERFPPLEPLEWSLWHGRIYFRVEPGRMPSDYEPRCCGLQTGITLYYVEGVLIRDLVVQGFAVDGVAVYDVANQTRLERLDCRANGKSGISVRGATWVELDDCHLYDNGGSQLRVSDFARLWLYDCRLGDRAAPAIEHRGGRLVIDGKRYEPSDLGAQQPLRSP
ncbi:MAG: right-handed parallel beta-helix repeat-containing protein [Planctomycetota bacterium]|nr:MAG: right-handed parallel beta-helix repeat-containing protein [Planctomycetota bacterium]